MDENELQITANIAKTMAMMGVRNTVLEDIHGGLPVASRTGDFSDVNIKLTLADTIETIRTGIDLAMVAVGVGLRQAARGRAARLGRARWQRGRRRPPSEVPPRGGDSSPGRDPVRHLCNPALTPRQGKRSRLEQIVGWLAGGSWEYGEDVSWVGVRLSAPRSECVRLTLTHTAHLSEHWGEYGPGAVGVGWELGLLGLAMYLTQILIDPAFYDVILKPTGRSLADKVIDEHRDRYTELPREPGCERRRSSRPRKCP